MSGRNDAFVAALVAIPLGVGLVRLAAAMFRDPDRTIQAIARWFVKRFGAPASTAPKPGQYRTYYRVWSILVGSMGAFLIIVGALNVAALFR